MTPEPVLVRVFGGSIVKRWLIGTCGNCATITNDSGAKAVQAGLDPPHAVGFPKSDVFLVPDWASDEGSGVDLSLLCSRF